MSAFAVRRERLWQSVKAQGLDAVLITNPINVTYLTGFSGDASFIVLTKSKALMVSGGRFKVQIAEECPGLDAFIRGPAQTTINAAIEQLTKLSLANIGFESGHLTVAEFEKFKDGVKSASWKRPNGVEAARIKDVDEIVIQRPFASPRKRSPRSRRDAARSEKTRRTPWNILSAAGGKKPHSTRSSPSARAWRCHARRRHCVVKIRCCWSVGRDARSTKATDACFVDV